MTSKVFVVFAFLIETLTAQSITRYNAGLYGNRAISPVVDAYGPYGPVPNVAVNPNYAPASPLPYEFQGLSLQSLSASNCGVTVTSGSPITPKGVFLQSENMVIEGPLAVNGQLPFLGTIALEGALPANGAGDVLYGCGNGNIGITNEEYPSFAANNYNPGHGYAPRAGPYVNNLAGVGRMA